MESAVWVEGGGLGDKIKKFPEKSVTKVCGSMLQALRLGWVGGLSIFHTKKPLRNILMATYVETFLV